MGKRQMLERIRSEEEYGKIAESIEELFYAEPVSEEAKILRELVQLVKRYQKEGSKDGKDFRKQ